MVIVIKSKKVYRASQMFVFGFVFYLVFMARLSSADSIDACALMFGGPLNQEGHTYTLTGNLDGDCMIYANNITIDGNNFSLDGNIASIGTDGVGSDNGTDGFSFTLRNINISGEYGRIVSYGGNSDSGNGGNGGNILVENSTGDSGTMILSAGGNSDFGTSGNGGNVTVKNLTGDAYGAGSISGYSDSGIVGSGGNIIVENSNMQQIASMGRDSVSGINGNGGNVTVKNSKIYLIGSFSGSVDAPGTGNAGDITIINSDILYNSEFGYLSGILQNGATHGSITITDDAPTLTLIGDENIVLGADEEYVEPGFTASDTKFETTDLTSSVIVIGEVPSAPESGSWDITYTVSDEGTLPKLNGEDITVPPGVNPNTTTVVRHVTRQGGGEPEPEVHHHTTSSGSYMPGYGPRANISSVVAPTTSTTPETKFIFNKNLKYLMVDNDVKELQKFLNTHGYPVSLTGPGSKGLETTKFGSLTKKALIKFQLANKITPAVGYFGPKTRAFIKSNNL